MMRALVSRRSIHLFWVIILVVWNGDRGWSQVTGSPTTIIIVRHAEKDTAKIDPSLSQAGIERSEALAHTLAEVEISAIYVSQFKRTKQTIQSVASLHNVTPTTFDMDLSTPKRYARMLADKILAEHKGQTVLVSNHSNIIPFIIEALGAGGGITIDESIYDYLFVVTRYSSGSATLVKLKFGKPSK